MEYNLGNKFWKREGKMKTKFLISIALYLVTAVVSSSLVFAQTQTPENPDRVFLQQAVSAKFENLRSSAKSAYSGILLYPKDVRDSVLELSQYPDLVLKMGEKKGAAPADVSQYPAEAQAAAKVLAQQKQVIAIMKGNLVVTSLLGEVVKDKKKEVMQAVDRLSESVDKESEASAKEWTEELQKNPEAVKQLQEAAATYAKENNLPDPNQPVSSDQVNNVTNVYNQYGYYVAPSGSVVVYDMPSQEVMNYMIARTAMWATLYGVIYHHHHMYYGGYYWNSYDDYWEDHADQINDSLNGIEDNLDDINKNLDEIQDKADDRRDQWQDRKDEVQPKVEEKRDAWETRKNETLPATADNLKAKDINRPANLPATKEMGPSRVPAARPSQNISYRSPSTQQRIGSASNIHSKSWSSASRGSSSYSRGTSGGSRSYSGGSRSSGRSSGGRRR